MLELGRNLLLPRIDPATLQFAGPAIPLRLGKALSAPRAEADRDARCATVMDDQPAFLESGTEPNQCVRAAEGAAVPVTRPVHPARHCLTAVGAVANRGAGGAGHGRPPAGPLLTPIRLRKPPHPDSPGPVRQACRFTAPGLD